jgi:integrase
MVCCYMARPSVRPSTFQSYRLNVRRARELLGRIKLNELTPAAIQAAYASLLREGLAPRTVWQMHMVLHRALRQAVLAGALLRNPVDGVSRPRASHHEIRTLTTEELKRLFEATKNHRLHALWVLLSTTGLRLGEGLGLKWEDINFQEGKLSVRRALRREPKVGFVLAEPKTAKSRRIVYLAPGTLETLKEHRERQDKDRRAARDLWQAEHDLVFKSDVGKPMQDGQVSWTFHQALAKADLPRIRIHDLRHTAATQLLERGVHPKVVQEMLGHSTITLTLDTYSHVMPGLHAHAANEMERLFEHRDREIER